MDREFFSSKIAFCVVIANLFAASPCQAIDSCSPSDSTHGWDGSTIWSVGNPYPQCPEPTGNCTWWAWKMASDVCNVKLPGWSDAGTWTASAKKAGYTVSDTPYAKSVAVRAGTPGHVAWVEDVFYQNGTLMVSVSQMDYEKGLAVGKLQKFQTLEASSFNGGFIIFDGCSGGIRPTVSLSLPADSQSYDSSTASVDLSWTASSNATNYRVIVSTDSTFAGFTDNSNSSTGADSTCDATCETWGTTAQLFTFPSAKSGKTYYWKVRANDSKNKVIGDWTPVRKFIISAPPPVISLSAPADSQTFAASTTNVPLSWTASADATNYRVIVSRNADFSGFSDSNGSSTCDSTCGTWAVTANSFTFPTAKAGQTYYWKVRANNSNLSVVSGWTAARKFSIGGTTTASGEQKLDQCHSKFSSLLGSKVGSVIPFANYVIQQVSGTSQALGLIYIAAKKDLSDDVLWFYRDGWKNIKLNACD